MRTAYAPWQCCLTPRAPSRRLLDASCLSNNAQTRLSVSEQTISVVRAEGSEVSRRAVQKIAELASNSWGGTTLAYFVKMQTRIAF